jgi:S1-C subfamily serine protease
MAAVNLLDALILVLVGLSIVAGFRRGAALQVVTYTGLVLGLIGGALLGPSVARLAEDPFVQAALALGTLLALAAVGDAVGWAIGRHVWAAARRSRLDPIDAGAGSVVAGVATLLVTWFLAFNLVQGPFLAVSRQIRESAVVRGLDAVLPRPPALIAQIRSFLDRFGFPEVFIGLPPSPAGPVNPPSAAQARQAFLAADQSTFRIVGTACGRIQEGSGFLVDDGLVVTNAHVVAGVEAPRVQAQDGREFVGSVVAFDPDRDLAILRLDSPPGEQLALAAQAADRGAVGAVIGYPGGGDLTGVKAAVRRALTAVGRDIYGQDTVEREIYELQTRVVPGNSGGPFVTPDGATTGVVFAASTSNDGIGYALTMSELRPVLNRARGREGAVGTGACIR